MGVTDNWPGFLLIPILSTSEAGFPGVIVGGLRLSTGSFRGERDRRVTLKLTGFASPAYYPGALSWTVVLAVSGV